MAKLNVIDKFIFFINSVVATLLLLSYILPFVPPKAFAFLSVLSLAVPFLMLVNMVFALYWLLKLKRQFLLSIVIVGIGYFYLGSFYKVSSATDIESENNLSIMSYNVRLFNIYEWIEDTDVETEISNLIQTQDPDILSLQEYRPGTKKVNLSAYTHQYVELAGDKRQFGQAIFSKYPIVKSGSITFPNTPNNAIFADIVKDKDTVRVYNIHLQSLRINTKVEALKQQDSERLFKSVGSAFTTQQYQTEMFLKHKNTCKYKMIITGDFNNTAYSYVYRNIKGDLIDTFKEAGHGFGRTYDFKFFPVRIDFILADERFTVNGFNTLNELYSDHYPIIAKLALH